MANKLRECMIVWEEEPGSGKWSVLAFDGVINEGFSGAVQVTSYPVDSGFMVSDHAIRQNRIIQLDTITSNFSMSVATSRKTFEESYNELMVAIGAAQQSTGAPVYEAGEVFDTQQALEGTGPTYADATKYGRAAYDNDSITFSIPYTSITLGTVTNPFVTALFGQVSIEKVDETVNTIDRLNALGKLVHVITLRGVRKNCVIRQFSTNNDVSNSYSAPVSITLEQLNVVDLSRSAVQTSTNYANGDVVAQEQITVRRAVPEAQTFQNAQSRMAPQVLDAPKMIVARTLMVEGFDADPMSVMPQTQSAATFDSGPLPTVPVSSPRDIVPSTFYELPHREIPFSTSFDTRFMHNSTEYTLGRVRKNAAEDYWVTSLSWKWNGVRRFVSSIPLVSGVNLVQQYATNMPSLVAVNIDERSNDPTTPENLRLYIIEQFDETFMGL